MSNKKCFFCKKYMNEPHHITNHIMGDTQEYDGYCLRSDVAGCISTTARNVCELYEPIPIKNNARLME